MKLTDQIKSIDLAALLESEGISLHRQGNKYLGLCPFHDDHNPSMSVFTDNHLKCWACGVYFDALGYVCERHGLTIKQGLRYLGIKQGPVTNEIRQRIRQAERKKRERQAYEQRKRDLMYTLAVEIRKANKVLSNIKNVEQMELLADLFHKLPYWEHCHHVLIHGDHQDVQTVMDELIGLKLINRKPLFKSDFNYRQWLRDVENGRTVSAI
jgi:hypothetical protein